MQTTSPPMNLGKTIQGSTAPLPLQLIQWFANPLNYLEANQKQYGEIFVLPFSLEFAPTVFVCNPKVVEAMFAGEPEVFYPINEGFAKYMTVFFGTAALGGSTNLEQQQTRRKLLMPAFHGKALHAYASCIREIAMRSVRQLQPDREFQVLSLTRTIARQTIYQGIFGLDDSENSQQLQHRFNQWADVIQSPLFLAGLFFPVLRWNLSWGAWRKFDRLNQDIAKFLCQEIAKHRQESDRESTNILKLLLSVRDETGAERPEREIQEQCKELIAAGLFATSAVMAWMCFCVYSHPEILTKLRLELSSLEQDDPLEIARLPYLTAVCKETLRLYPAVLFSLARVVQKPMELEGYALEPGMRVVACSYLIQRREDIYPQPEEFRPERFLDGKFFPHEYLPFGGGMRRCLGWELAMLEMKLTLATLVQTPGLELASDRPIKIVRDASGAIQPVNLKMVLKA